MQPFISTSSRIFDLLWSQEPKLAHEILSDVAHHSLQGLKASIFVPRGLSETQTRSERPFESLVAAHRCVKKPANSHQEQQIHSIDAAISAVRACPSSMAASLQRELCSTLEDKQARGGFSLLESPSYHMIWPK